ncbi:MAG: MacB family efflux pump subunit [Succinivibrio sp.]|nr:MacB family efflux pump subunit [Succinivibrio sp.]
MGEVLLALKDIRRSYGEGSAQVEVLHGINFTVERGEMVAIIGPSGSGKSTLMNIIGCLDKPTSGAYTVSGRDTLNLEADELAELRRNFFGFIFQRYHLLGHLNAAENVQVPSIYAGLKLEKRQERSLQLLDRLGLLERHTHLPSQLSGGQQQRVSIARALMNGGQIILADEPTGALDSKSGAEVIKILEELNAQGHTVILVTHDPNIARHARRVITIRDGIISSDEINEQVPDRRGHTEQEDEVNLQRRWLFSVQAYVDRFKEAYIMALRAMISNRMRTLLTMLGIIIGIMAVVSVVALARGASQKVVENISSMGTNTITIMPGAHMGDVRSNKVRTLNFKDLKALRGQPFVDSISATVSRSVYLRSGNLENQATAYGINTDYFRVYGMEVEQGRLFTEDEAEDLPQVCVIDYNTKKTFFPNEDAIGKRLLFGSVPMKVIGVLANKEIAFRPQDNLYVYVPYATFTARIQKQSYLSSVIVRVADGFATAVAENSITSLLTTRHGRRDFFVQSSDTIMKSINQTTGTFTLLISAIAVISLIVGGIGVMNIMLVSVTERTKEIGIRMAVGARQSDIMTQFLIESITVCIIGGLAGVVLSVGLGVLLSYAAPSVPMSFSVFSIVVAVLTSSVIGVVFGFMPARNAARLNPIEALARE